MDKGEAVSYFGVFVALVGFAFVAYDLVQNKSFGFLAGGGLVIAIVGLVVVVYGNRL